MDAQASYPLPTVYGLNLGNGCSGLFRIWTDAVADVSVGHSRIEFCNRKQIMATCFILGCGDTGMFMPDKQAYVIGVNDAGKFNKSIDELLFINRPRHFNEPALYIPDVSRLDVIKRTPFHKLMTLETLEREWRELFGDQVHTFTVTRWAKTLQLGQVYHTDNSPFTAMTYAVTLGYKNVVLWGVDFNNHRYLKAVNSSPPFSQYAMAVSKMGVTIYKGHTDQKLNLPLWS